MTEKLKMFRRFPLYTVKKTLSGNGKDYSLQHSSERRFKILFTGIDMAFSLILFRITNEKQPPCLYVSSKDTPLHRSQSRQSRPTTKIARHLLEFCATCLVLTILCLTSQLCVKVKKGKRTVAVFLNFKGAKESIPPGWESIPRILKRFTNSGSG